MLKGCFMATECREAELLYEPKDEHRSGTSEVAQTGLTKSSKEPVSRRTSTTCVSWPLASGKRTVVLVVSDLTYWEGTDWRWILLCARYAALNTLRTSVLKYRRAMLPLTRPLPSSTCLRGRARTPFGGELETGEAMDESDVVEGEEKIGNMLTEPVADSELVSDEVGKVIEAVADALELSSVPLTSKLVPMTVGTVVGAGLATTSVLARIAAVIVMTLPSPVCREGRVETEGSILAGLYVDAVARLE